ncbi:MAG: amino-acid N-acetyltransferase [Granulosicoccus sp.]
MKFPKNTVSAAIDWFRAASPYINAHRHKTLVIALPGEYLESELLPTLTHDLTLLNHLGMRLVVCFGLRCQVDEQLAKSSGKSQIVEGRRVTDDTALETMISAAGVIRNDLEARLSMGLPNTPMAGARLSVSSGNFVTARPFGIHNGIDFQHTGAVREVHHEAISALLNNEHLVILPPLGYSLTGEVFNLTVNELASECAIALRADKLIFFVDALPETAGGEPVRQASAQEIQNLLVNNRPAIDGIQQDGELSQIIPHAISACRRGVARVHLLKNKDPDALLTELFTHDGSGTLITASRWEHLRSASIQDVGGIIEIIEPLQADGAMVSRSREQLELDIEHFIVTERDGMVVSCAAMYTEEESESVEIACLATHPDYRGEGRADQMLWHLEERARKLGYQTARVLSTHTGHWFMERGYTESRPEQLPEARRSSYNSARNSKIYQKTLK